jgi:hypothetical protein
VWTKWKNLKFGVFSPKTSKFRDVWKQSHSPHLNGHSPHLNGHSPHLNGHSPHVASGEWVGHRCFSQRFLNELESQSWSGNVIDAIFSQQRIRYRNKNEAFKYPAATDVKVWTDSKAMRYKFFIGTFAFTSFQAFWVTNTDINTITHCFASNLWTFNYSFFQIPDTESKKYFVTLRSI